METISGALQNVEGPIVEDEFDEEAAERETNLKPNN